MQSGVKILGFYMQNLICKNIMKNEDVYFYAVFVIVEIKKGKTYLCVLPFFVTTVGFEPTRPYEHHPLKMASLPFLHVA